MSTDKKVRLSNIIVGIDNIIVSLVELNKKYMKEPVTKEATSQELKEVKKVIMDGVKIITTPTNMDELEILLLKHLKWRIEDEIFNK